MRSIIKAFTVTAVATGTIAAGAVAAPANAQPVAVGNLVNVQISNLLNNNEVVVEVAAAVPISVAANICGVQVGAIAADLEQDQEATCEARGGDQLVTITQDTTQ